MARSTATIKQNIMNSIAADPILSPLLTSTSLTAIYGLFAYIIAAVQNLFEQVWDNYLLQLESYANKSPGGSAPWIQQQAFIYQYDPSGAPATNTLSIIANGAVGYATVDESFRIVTRCAVNTTGSNEVTVKVAQSDSPAPISGLAFTQLDSYLTAKIPAGVNHTLISLDSDKIYIKGTVYFKPGFGGVAQTNVEAALNAFLKTLSIAAVGSTTPVNYDGIIKVADIIDVIKTTDGIDDFKLDELKCRANATAFASTTTVYDLLNAINNRSYIMAAGYGVAEDTPTYTWADTISYTSA